MTEGANLRVDRFGTAWWRRFAVGLLAVVVVAEIAARVTLGAADTPILRWHDYSAQLKIEQMDERGPVDVVIVGTSMAQQDLVPEVLGQALDGRQVYNAGLNGGVPVVMEPWVLDHVVPRLEPTVVLWGLSPLDMSAAYGEATQDAFDTALATRPGLLAVLERAVAPYSELIAGRQALRDPDRLFGSERTLQREQLADALAALGVDGERLEFDEALGASRAAEMAGRITPFQLDRDDLAAIARTVASLRAQGIEVVFVELPVPDRFRALYPRGPQQQQVVSDTIAELAAALDVAVIPVDGPSADAAFVDFTHLSSRAAQEFSEAVGAEGRNTIAASP